MAQEGRKMIRLLSKGLFGAEGLSGVLSGRQVVRVLGGAVLVTGVALPVFAQSAGDVVVIGNSPNQWNRNQTHWNQIMGLNRPKPATPKGEKPGAVAAVDPKVLAGNVRVSNLKIVPIVRLNGSSQVSGTVTNGNRQPVTVTGVNFQVFDDKGNLLQTGAVAPQPATIGPGQSVTFQQTLLTVPADSGATVRLSDPAVTVQP
jgi:hypothetical protein